MSQRVFLHGFTGLPADGAAFEPVTAPAIAGHDPAIPIADGYRFADEIARLSAQLPDQPTHLIGYSMGARLALSIAASAPASVDRLTLIGVHPGLTDPDERKVRRQQDERWCELLEQRGIEAFAQAWRAQPMWTSQRSLPEAIRAGKHAQLCSHDPMQLARAMRALGLAAMPSVWSALERLTMPVHLITGTLDGKFTALAQRMAERLPCARITTITGAGHNPILERPADVVRAACDRAHDATTVAWTSHTHAPRGGECRRRS